MHKAYYKMHNRKPKMYKTSHLLYSINICCIFIINSYLIILVLLGLAYFPSYGWMLSDKYLSFNYAECLVKLLNNCISWSLMRVLVSILDEALGPIPETIQSIWKSDRITNFSSAHDFSIRSDSTNDPASIWSWSWRCCSLRGSVLDQKFHHSNWSFYK